MAKAKDPTFRIRGKTSKKGINSNITTAYTKTGNKKALSNKKAPEKAGNANVEKAGRKKKAAKPKMEL